jgi:glutathione S-transferase
MNKKESAYAAARTDLLREMLRASVFEMESGTRAEFVGATVRDLRRQHDDLDETLARKLTAEGMTFTYGDANLAVAAARGRGMERDVRADMR